MFSVQAAVVAADELARLLEFDDRTELDDRTEFEERLELDDSRELEALERLLLIAAEDDTATLDVDEAVVAQPVPLTTGISGALSPLVPCTPNSTNCLGWMVLFQLKLLAV